jgi:hypothetical protein
MTPQDRQEVTGLKMPSAQARWFKDCFGITVVQAADRRIILSWAAFENLMARRVGTQPVAEEQRRPTLQPVRRPV